MLHDDDFDLLNEENTTDESNPSDSDQSVGSYFEESYFANQPQVKPLKLDELKKIFPQAASQTTSSVNTPTNTNSFESITSLLGSDNEDEKKEKTTDEQQQPKNKAVAPNSVPTVAPTSLTIKFGQNKIQVPLPQQVQNNAAPVAAEISQEQKPQSKPRKIEKRNLRYLGIFQQGTNPNDAKRPSTKPKPAIDKSDGKRITRSASKLAELAGAGFFSTPQTTSTRKRTQESAYELSDDSYEPTYQSTIPRKNNVTRSYKTRSSKS